MEEHKVKKEDSNIQKILLMDTFFYVVITSEIIGTLFFEKIVILFHVSQV